MRIKTRIVAVWLTVGLAFGVAREASAQMGGMGRMVAPDPNRVTTATANNLIAIETAEKDGIKVYNIEQGSWSVYRATKGTRARPVGGSGYFIVTNPEGKKITQLAAYSEKTGTWITQDLKEPVEESLPPIVGPSMAVYDAGTHIYAYSGLTSSWAVLDLLEASEESPSVGGKVATVTHKNRLYIFNAKFGRWDNSGDKPK